MAYTLYKLTRIAFSRRQVQTIAWVVLALAGAGCAPAPAPRKLTIAAAADLRFAMDAIAAEWAKSAPGSKLELAYGSSGTFFAQIENGAPYDVFLSADIEYPRKLIAKGKGVGDFLFTYGAGRLVVWVPAASPLDPATALRDAGWKHLAIANPQHAPYGRAAVAALRGMGIYDRVADRLVLGENVAQTLEFVESGAAELGMVALSLAVAPSNQARGRYWELPLESYPRLEQAGLVLKDTAETRAFRAFLLSAAGRGILKQYGFFLPGE